MDATIDLAAITVLAVVSRGSENHDTGIDQLAHSSTNRIVDIGVDSRHAEAHIDDTNVVTVSIRHDPIERAQHGTGVTDAFLIQHPQVDEVCIWSYTQILTIGNSPVSSG